MKVGNITVYLNKADIRILKALSVEKREPASKVIKRLINDIGRRRGLA